MRIYAFVCAFVLSIGLDSPYVGDVMTYHNRAKVVNGMAYVGGGYGCGVGYGVGYGAIGFVLVLFILLVIILRAGFIV